MKFSEWIEDNKGTSSELQDNETLDTIMNRAEDLATAFFASKDDDTVREWAATIPAFAFAWTSENQAMVDVFDSMIMDDEIMKAINIIVKLSVGLVLLEQER